MSHEQWQSAGVEVKLSFGEPALALTEDAAADPAAREQRSQRGARERRRAPRRLSCRAPQRCGNGREAEALR